MFKRIMAMMVCLAIVCSPLYIEVKAASESEAVRVVQALGIMNGDENGNMNLNSQVTRAEFAKMVVAASVYEDRVRDGGGVSLYTDVKGDHWASPYIEICVDQGWFMGYSDGSFKPSQPIRLEEGAAVLLRVLGYERSDLEGAFPTAQLNKYEALGLDEGVETRRGENLSRKDCALMFYNLLSAETKSNTVYGTSIDVAVEDGEVNFFDLVKDNLQGPYLSETGNLNLPFTPERFIRNGRDAFGTDVGLYDVYYYSEAAKTVWLYNDQVSGLLSKVGPNTLSPENVTVGGSNYDLEGSDIMMAVSSLGSYKEGDVVTLILDKDGKAFTIMNAEALAAERVGMVLSDDQKPVAYGDTEEVLHHVRIAYTDGTTGTVFAERLNASVDDIVSVTYEDGKVTVNEVKDRNLDGTVDGDSIDGIQAANDIQIIDIGEGQFSKVYLNRLDGVDLSGEKVRYYKKNSKGEIDTLILNNVTGDGDAYIYITDAEESSDGLYSSGSYTYLIEGNSQSTSSSNGSYNVNVGGAVLITGVDGSRKLRNIDSVKVDAIDGLYMTYKDDAYRISEDVQVYLKDRDTYHTLTLDSIRDASRYNYHAWVDSKPGGGRVRIIMVTEK